MGTLILIRHGQSQWNLENRFTGWTDVPLTPRGAEDAARAGEALKEYQFDIAFTSRLIRATDTLKVMLETLKREVPTIYDSALNERHYGDLQGLNKAETAQKLGEEQVRLWRRSYATRPPNGESIQDCEHRTTPFFTQYVMPYVLEGKTVLLVAHGNSLRPIMKYLEDLEAETISSLEIGLCTPYIYTFEDEKVVNKEVVEVPGIVTKGSSTKEATVEEGTV